jgi:hypothetical protein
MKKSEISIGRYTVILLAVCISMTVQTNIANSNEIFEYKEMEYVFLEAISLIIKGTAEIEDKHAQNEIKK